jgi:putative endonuclease
MYKNKLLGTYGEQTAINYLESQGYIILSTNYRCKLGEIDIIAADGDIIAFIEVKTRRSEKFGQPRESVNYSKQMKIVKTALHYITKKKLTDWMSRFDVVEVFVGSDNTVDSITLIKDAFEYSGNLGY